ncbi:actin-related protein 2/3 complex subunit 1A [Cimex lectularius]|uniref:Actin-related protein 2/3 complex subunit n=1 Tax=Cimex lectularius TaxID=79782 RepID=A0A8I6RR59_CIMLE|nr:actin-related protein 2/3 complex subunit 1A [Cimex lectularius]
MWKSQDFGINPITCHAWNKTSTQLALSLNNNEVYIYQKGSSDSYLDWTLIDVLDQHNLRVTGIDWAPETNRIVTCAADRNAYVWTQTEDGKWKPTLVFLRINRAATCVKWSPKENKFAVGSGARLISICYFESGNDWWVSKHIKKPIRSTVTCLDWHPNNYLLAAGFADFKVRVYSALAKEIEGSDIPPSKWANKTTLGTMVAEFSNSPFGGGWIRGVSFSPDGNKLAWVGQDSSICLVDITKGLQVQKVKTIHLPFLNLIWVGPNSIVTAGHGCCPFLYEQNTNGQFQYKYKLDVSKKKQGERLSAMKKFQSLDRQARVEACDIVLNTVHQNAITCLQIYEGKRGNTVKLSSTGIDGQLVIWDLKEIAQHIANHGGGEEENDIMDKAITFGENDN